MTLHDPERQWARPVEEVARAIYATIPTFTIVMRYDTSGGDRVPVRVEDSWEEAEDRHEELMRMATTAIAKLRELGFVNIQCLEAIKAEEKGNGK